MKKSTEPTLEFKPQRYFKVLAPNNKHYDMIYKENDWNTNIEPYFPEGECQSGGIYFTTLENIFSFLHYGDGIVEVLDYKDDKGKKEFYHEEFKMKAHAVKLGKKKLYTKELIKEFVDNGAQLNRLSREWSSPVAFLVHRHKFDIAEMLLDLGADPSEDMTHDVLKFMIQTSNVGAINLLLKYYSEGQYRDYITKYDSNLEYYGKVIIPGRLKRLHPNIV